MSGGRIGSRRRPRRTSLLALLPLLRLLAVVCVLVASVAAVAPWVIAHTTAATTATVDAAAATTDALAPADVIAARQDATFAPFVVRLESVLDEILCVAVDATSLLARAGNTSRVFVSGWHFDTPTIVQLSGHEIEDGMEARVVQSWRLPEGEFPLRSLAVDTRTGAVWGVTVGTPDTGASIYALHSNGTIAIILDAQQFQRAYFTGVTAGASLNNSSSSQSASNNNNTTTSSKSLLATASLSNSPIGTNTTLTSGLSAVPFVARPLALTFDRHSRLIVSVHAFAAYPALVVVDIAPALNASAPVSVSGLTPLVDSWWYDKGPPSFARRSSDAIDGVGIAYTQVYFAHGHLWALDASSGSLLRTRSPYTTYQSPVDLRDNPLVAQVKSAWTVKILGAHVHAPSGNIFVVYDASVAGTQSDEWDLPLRFLAYMCCSNGSSLDTCVFARSFLSGTRKWCSSGGWAVVQSRVSSPVRA